MREYKELKEWIDSTITDEHPYAKYSDYKKLYPNSHYYEDKALEDISNMGYDSYRLYRDWNEEKHDFIVTKSHYPACEFIYSNHFPWCNHISNLAHAIETPVTPTPDCKNEPQISSEESYRNYIDGIKNMYYNECGGGCPITKRGINWSAAHKVAKKYPVDAGADGIVRILFEEAMKNEQ